MELCERVKNGQYKADELPPGATLLVLVFSLLGLWNAAGAAAIDRLMQADTPLGPVSELLRRRRRERDVEFAQEWRKKAAVALVNALGTMICRHIQKALLAAGVPHTHDLYCAVWGFSRDQTADEREAAAYLGGRDRDDVRSHELMDRRLINGQFRRGAMGAPWGQDDSSDHTVAGASVAAPCNQNQECNKT